MKKVFKYTVRVTDVFTIEMPRGAKFLRAMAQGEVGGQPQLWALVDPAAPVERRHFRLVGTGHPIEDFEVDRLSFIDTFMLENGELVFHLFERVPLPSSTDTETKR